MRSGRAASPVAGSDALRRGSLSSIKIWAAVVLVALLVTPAVIGLTVIPTIAQTDKPLPVINQTPAGIPEKFEEAFYEKILKTISERSDLRSSGTTPQYYTVVVIVERYGPDGTDVSEMNKARIVEELKEAGAKDIASAETLSFVIASVPVGKIMGLSTHEEVHLLGDGQLPLRSLASNPTVTVNATVAALTTANGIADGSGARVAILEQTNIDYSFVNDKIILSLDCSSHPCTPASSSPPSGFFHADAVAHFIGTTGHVRYNGISPGAEIISLASGGMVAGEYYALDWAVSNDVDVVNMSIGPALFCTSSARYSINVISNDVVLSGTTLASAAGNQGPGYETLGMPCSYNIINVGGIDDSGSDITMSSFASRGPYHVIDRSTHIATVMKPEIVAPAASVPVAFPGSGISGISVVSGTSYSAPQVSAAVAVLAGENDYLSPEDVRATLFLGADWTGPVPCTSVQFEQNNATDDCSYARQPPAANATSISILNNVGFGILNVGQSLYYTLQGNGQHVVAGDLLHDDVLEYQFNITSTARPVKVILTWLNNAFDVAVPIPDDPTYFTTLSSGRIYNLDLEVTCPGMDAIHANSTHQNNEFAVFMPNQTGTCTAQVSSSDSRSYDSRKRFALASTIPLNVESTPPRISVTSPVNATVITLAVDFGNAIKPDTFTASDVTTSTGTVSEPTTGDSQTFGFNITNPANEDIEISIAAGTVEYVSGNINAEAHTRIERAPPTVVLSTIMPSPTNAKNAPFTATFSEPVAFDSGISDISVAGGAASNLLPSGTAQAFTFTVTPTDDGEVTVQIPADAASDTAGNGNIASVVSRLTFDRTAPTVTSLTASEQSPTNAQSVTFTAAFSEPVAFDSGISDISVTGGAASNLSPSGTAQAFTFTVTPTDDGEVTVQIPADAASDTAGNGNIASVVSRLTFDRTAPTVTSLTASEQSPTNAQSVTFTAAFSEPVAFDSGISDISVTGGAASNLSPSGTSRTFTFIVTPTDDGEVTVQIPADAASDTAGNGNIASVVSRLTFDRTAPTVTSLTASEQSPTNAQSATFTAAFSEPVAFGSGISDISVMGGAASNLSPSGTSRTFTFIVTPTGYGVVTASIPAGSVADLAGNTNTVSNTRQITFEMSDPEAFITTWKTTTADESITLPISGSGMTVDWGDGNTTTASGPVSHTYNTAGDHTIQITGELTRFHLSNAAYASKLVSLDQWGTASWSTMENAFRRASNMAYNAVDSPDLSSVTDMQNMFSGASSFDQPIDSWNVSKVTNMNFMFFGASSFDQPLNSWNVSAVTDMNYMFSDASKFNQPLNDWDVSAVTNMNYMFSDASTFDGDISDWDVSAVTDMHRMFHSAFKFNQPLNSWNVSSVTNMSYMFLHASEFNQPLNSWNVSAVTDMPSMFFGASTFNGDISDWDVSAVTDMRSMFHSAFKFNQPLNSWNVSSAINMSDMFLNADDFEQNLGKWYVVPADTDYDAATESTLVITAIAAQNSVLDGHFHNYGIGTGDNSDLFSMTGNNLMFKATTPSAGTYTVNVTAPGGDFGTNNHRVLDIKVEGQDDSTVSADAFVTTWNVTASPYEVSISVEVHTGGTLTIDWGDAITTTAATNGIQSHIYLTSGEYQVSMTGDLSRIILGAAGGTPSKLASIDQWGDIEWISMQDAFRDASNMVYAATDTPDLSGVSRTDRMFDNASSFNGDISTWNVSSVTNMRSMFHGASAFDRPLNDWNVSSVTNMRSMFHGASAFDRPLNDWNVSSVRNMNSMFNGASDFNQPLNDWNVSSVTNMNSMFNGASSFDQPLNDWNVSSVTNMNSMFNGASSFDQPLNDWNVSKVTTMESMFYGAASFDQPLDSWNVSKMTTMESMFALASSFNGDISTWNVSSVTNMNSMFNGASAFDQPLISWDVSSVRNMLNMFTTASKFDQPLNDWDVSAVTFMRNMFSGASSFDQLLNDWDVSAVISMSGMFSGASSFDQPLNSWNVSSVTDMDFMFDNANAFDQNLGSWYVVPVDIDYDAATETTLVITAIAAQNSVLDGHSPNYGIGTGNNSELFSMTGSTLMFKVTPSTGDYKVNVTASGSGVFESGNNWRTLTVTVTGQEDRPLLVDAGPDQRVLDGSTVELQGIVSGITDPTYLWTQNSGSPAVALTDSDTPAPTFTAPDVSSDVDLIFTLTVNDGTETVTDTVTITVHDAEADFVTTWNNIVTGINLPIRSSAGSFTVDWGDGDISEYAAVTTDRNLAHFYVGSGPYTIRISGDFSEINLQGSTGAAGKLQSIDQWGDIEWTTMVGAFYFAENMAYNAIDAPDLSSVTDMTAMFASTDFSGNLSGWDVSSVTNMNGVFRNSGYTGDLSGWDVSSVTNMNGMFRSTSSFNSDLSGWDVSKVTDMGVMFQGASSFDQNLGNWYVVPADLVYDAATETSLVVTAIATQNSFLDDHFPNYGIGTDGDSDLFSMTGSDLEFKNVPSAGNYTVTVTASGSNVFENGNNWRTLTVTVTGQEDRPLLVDAGTDQRVLDGSPVTLTGIVSGSTNPTYSWTQNPGSPAVTLEDSDTLMPTFTAPDVSSDVDLVFTLRVDDGTDIIEDTVTVTVHNAEADFVTTWSNIATGINLPIRSSAGSFTVDWGDGDISEYAAVTTDSDIQHAYGGSGPFTIRISGDFSGINLEDSSHVAERLQSIDQWGDIKWTTMEGAFYFAGNMIYNATDVPDLSSVTDMSSMFFSTTSFSSGDLSGWDVSSVANMNSMFRSSGYTGDLSGWDVSSVANMNNMFRNISSFNSDLSGWNVSSVENMNSMFYGASSFNSDLSGWGVSSVTDMSAMFRYASSFNSDLSGWGVSSVTDMSAMFDGATSFNRNLGAWYVVPDSTSIARAEVPGKVGEISAQNGWLTANHNPTYGIGTGGDSNRFEIVNGNQINMTSVEAKSAYKVNVTASGTNVFEDGNNWRILDVTVSGEIVNTAPTVNAGVDQDAVEGSDVSLGASVEDDDTEDTLTYTWTHNSTFSITLAGGDTAAPTFTAPRVLEETTIEFTLTVNDGTVDVTDKILVTVTDSANRPPSVNAGSDQTVAEGSDVSLAASVSDLDTEDELAYAWTHNSTFSITLAGGDTAAPTFTAPRVLEETTIEFTLTVNDGTVDVTDKIIVTITDSANSPPEVNAGNDQQEAEGSTVSLDATVTDDDTEDTLTYTWTHNSTLSISLDDSSAVDTTFTAPNVAENTVVEFTLTVYDGTATVSDKILVTITDSANSPPEVNAGNDQQEAEGSTVSLDATVTDDDTEDTLTYTWTHNSTLSISLDDSSAVDTTFTAPNVAENTVVEFTLTVYDGTATVSDKILVTITDSANSPPEVNAGNDQQEAEGSTVSLDATVTDDDTEDTLTYTWTHNSTLSISLDDSSAVDTTFTAPNVAENTVVEFTLTVYDGTATVSDKILVTITDSANSPPEVNAGNDQQEAEGSTVSLDATVTDDDTEDTLTYTWTHNSTLSISLDDSSAVDTTFTAPNVSETTVVEFTLTVSDGTASVSDEILVTITDSANSPPEVNAGNDQQEAEGSTVSLDATVTDDDTEDTLTYTWTHNSTLSISLDDSSAVDTTFTAPNVSETTVVEFTLTVSDGTASVSDEILVTITDSANSPPEVNAGNDQQEAEGSTVSLDATVTDDDTEDTLTYTWTHNSTLSITLANDSVPDTTFTAPNVSETTVVEFTLTVSDGTASVSDEILVTITDSANSPPEVNAGNDQQEAEGSTVSLDATVTDDDTEDTLTYTWTHNSTLSITLANDSVPDTTFTAPNVAENTVVEFTLTVYDGTATVSDKILVTITDSANSPPEVNAGNDQQEAEGSTVSLDATVTDDDTEDTLTYTWTHNSTLSISLDDSSAVDTTFTAPNVAENTVVEFTLTVYDGTATVSDKILVTITDSANSPPEVNAGNDQQEAEGSTVSLDATVTDDDTEDTLTYTWTHNSTLSISLDDSSAVDTTFTAPNVAENTVVEFTLTVSDGTASVSDEVLVTITDSANSPPEVNAGNDQQEAEGSTVSLDATVTDDDTEDTLTYTWTHNSTLSITLANDSVPDTTFTAPNVAETTVVEFTLTVSDGTASVSDKILVTITDSANSPPEVNAGNDQQEAEGSTVSLDATVTDDDTEDTLTYTWTHNSTLSITLANDSVPDTTFTAPNVAENTVVEFTLTVYDGTATVSDKILVTITDSANSPPEVNAGNDQQEAEGSTVSLDATVTDDDTEDTLTYTWTHNSTLSITLANDSVPDTTFTAPNVSETTVVEFTLTVYDGTATVSDKILVTITDSANSPPEVNAGNDQQEAEGSTVSLDATVTDDDTEDTLTYTWTHNSTLSITLANDSVPDTTFTAPNVSETTVVEFTLTVYDGTATVSDKILVTITDSANSPPEVNAGNDQQEAEGSTVSLDATVTDDDTEDTLTYTWTHNSTLSISLDDSSAVDTTFTAPNVAENTVVEFTLTVYDGTATVSDKILVTITDSANSPPEVNAGNDQQEAEGSTVSLDATVTDDDTEDTLTYTWTHNSTLSISLDDSSAVDTTFTAPNVSETTVVEFTLTVSDGTASVSDEILVTITDSANSPPEVNAGNDQQEAEGSTVSLDATVTDDDTEDTLTYTWTHNSTLSITLANDSVPDTTFTAPNVSETTVVEFTLTVSDGTASVSDEILVTITDSANSPPEVNAGNDQQEAEGSTVSLDATVTDDDTGDTLTYTWTHNSTLSISLDDSSAVDTTFTAPNVAENTVVEFTLTVSDGTASVSDEVLVTITDSANSPPEVNAGNDQQEAEGSTVSLDATVTDDDTEDTLTYTWTHNSTLSITLANDSVPDTTFTAPNVAENTVVEFTLTVYDGTATVSDKILVTITDSANSPPEVNAGNDQQEAEGSTVSLDATVTDDDTEDTLTYTWTHNSTLSISLDDSSAVDTSFTAPNVAENTVVEFTLTVYDGTATVSDKILVTITDSANSPPEVNAGNDQQEAEGSTVSLDATVTDDDTEDTLTYTWTHNSTLSITLANDSVPDTTFTAPNVAENTVVEFTLTVYDGTATVSDKILVTITDSANSPPEVNAGNDQQEAEGSTVSLDATVTDDDTEDTLTYTWTHNSTLSITLANDSVPDTTFTAPNVAENTVVEFTLTVYDGTATVSDKILVTITDSANSPPEVNAGNDQQEAEGSTVSLDATVTDDDTGDTLTYTWTHNSTLSISLDDSSAVDTSFTAPNVAENTVVEFTLTVYDGTATVSDKILVTITDSANSPPMVNAGNDQQEAEGSTVSLDATVTDTDTEDTLTYTWTHNSTLSISLDDSSAVDTTFTAPNVAENTVVEFTLTVYDGTATVSDKILVTITDSANSPPEVNAGNDQQEAEGSTVNLDATVTDDDTGDTLTYTWTHNSTLSISLDDSSAVDTSFTAPNVAENTVVEFTLTVYDGTATVSDKILVTITDSANSPPMVNAGNDQQEAEGSTVNLDATVTDDDTGDTLTYTWTHNSTLSISLDDSSAVDTSFTAPNVAENTVVEFTLTVYDGTATVSDKILVTITDSANSPPMVNAGNDQQEAEGSTVSLDATVTDTDTEDTLTYTWTHNSTLSISLDDSSAVDTTFTAPNVAENTVVEFTLTVYDGTATVSDKILVTITDSANSPPEVNAGNDQQEAEGSTVSLDATVTDDDTGDTLTYTWTHNSTLSISLDDSSAVDTTFTAPNVAENTVVEFTLTVYDGTATVSDKILVTITDSANSPPMVNAGNDQQEAEGSTVSLDATVTDDDTGDTLTYTWTHNSTLSISFDDSSAVDTSFTAPNVAENTVVEFTLTVYDGTATVSDKILVTITDSANSPPEVNAGNDQQEAEGSTVSLDATVTDDDTGDTLTYTWTHNSTLSISLDDSSAVDTTFTAPNVAENTVVEFTLTVYDGTATVSDKILVTITDSANSPPEVNAGNDQQEAEGSTVSLDATVTDDDTGDTLTYTWTHNSTLSISLDDSSAVDTTFTAPNVAENTVVEFTLTVYDGTATVSDKILVTITDSANSPPEVNAGNDQQEAEGSTVSLDATVTDDDTGDTLTYTWTHNSTLSISLDDSSAVDTTFTAPNVAENTVVEFTLTVYDGTATVSDKILVTITDSANSPPEVNAGNDQQEAEGSTVSLDATVTDDDTEDTLTYTWTHNSTLSISLDDSSAVDTTFTAPNVAENTVVEFTLTVYDGTATVSDKILVTITDSANSPPEVNAGNDQQEAEGSTVSLDATVTDDDTEDTLTYTWTHNSTLSISLDDSSAVDTTFTAPNVAENTVVEFTLTVYDGTATVSDKILVTITDSANSPPEVNAGNDQQEAEGSTVSLDATVTDDDTEDTLTYTWTHNSTLSISLDDSSAVDTTFTAPNVAENTVVEFTLTVYDGTATVSDKILVTITDSANSPPAVDASRKNTSSSSSKAPAVHINALAQAGIVDIPPHIAEQAASHDASDPLEPIAPDGTFDFPLVINGYGYLLDDATNTLVPQTVTAGDDDHAIITFTVYTQKDLAHFTLYLNLQGENTNYANSDTYITYRDDGTTGVTDPHGYIGNSATITVTQNDDQIPERKTVRIIVEFAEPMGTTNMVAYMWNTDRKAVFVKIIDAFEVVAALLEPVVQAADPEPLEPDSVLPADPEPVAPDFADDAADPEPVPADALWPADDYDEAQVLTLIRMWSGFESEMITDTQLLELLGLEGYRDVDLPDWMMTQLGVLVAKGDVTVGEFVLALQYVLEHA